MKRSFNCNGNVTENPVEQGGGEVIQLQGDQRENVKEWLLAQEIVLKGDADRLVLHGF